MDISVCNYNLPSAKIIQKTKASDYIVDYTAFELSKDEVESFNENAQELIFGDVLIITASRCGRIDAWSMIRFEESKFLYEVPPSENQIYCLRGFLVGESTRNLFKANSCFFFLAGGSEKTIYLYEATKGQVLLNITDRSYNSDFMVFSKLSDGSLFINDSLFAAEQQKTGGFDSNYVFGVGPRRLLKLYDLSTGKSVESNLGEDFLMQASLNCVEPICLTNNKKGIIYCIGEKSSTLTIWKMKLVQERAITKKIKEIYLPFIWVLTVASFWKYYGTKKYKDIVACGGGFHKGNNPLSIINWRRKQILRTIICTNKWINVIRINYFLNKETGKEMPVLIKGGADEKLQYRSLLTGQLIKSFDNDKDLVVMHGMKVLTLFKQGGSSRDILLSSVCEMIGVEKINMFKVSM